MGRLFIWVKAKGESMVGATNLVGRRLVPSVSGFFLKTPVNLVAETVLTITARKGLSTSRGTLRRA